MSESILDAVNKSLALVLWAKDEKGEDDVAVFSGMLVQEKNEYLLKREGGANVELQTEWLHRIRKVPKELRAILLDCEYQLPLSVGDKPNDSEGYEKTGLKWPTD